MDAPSGAFSGSIVLHSLLLGLLLGVIVLGRRVFRSAPPDLAIVSSKSHPVTVFFASQKGHCRRFADCLAASARARGVEANIIDLTSADPDRLVEHHHAAFIVATYAGGSAVPGTEGFFHEVTEMSRDFRVEKSLLGALSFAVFGAGNSEYPAKDFNATARRLDRALRLLGARRLLPRCEGDDIDNALSEQFEDWLPTFWRAYEASCAALTPASGDPNSQSITKAQNAKSRRLQKMLRRGELDAARAEDEAARRAEYPAASVEVATFQAGGEGGSASSKDSKCCSGGGGGDGNECGCSSGGGGKGVGGKCQRGVENGFNEPAAAEDERVVADGLMVESDEEQSEHGDDGGYGSEGGEVVDVEDLGYGLVKRETSADVSPAERKPMVTPSLKASLQKQGYKIVGSHSGVKLCRWTKAMLRGRGGCYKHTFYGIVSYQCMEATPSLACANKCVFCWRHHDNPVGTSFRWQVDSPEELIKGFEQNHLQMMKQLKGVPGVKPERYAEATKRIRHCALSLVGEPIIYPRINQFLNQLHARGISSFMVTNAQFPEQMESLVPVTQLYISVDAPTAAELKAVDRPLFPDFWERFLQCVDLLRAKKQRTVFRMTLVNGWNTEQLSKYVELVRRGQPDFVEVKGVTYCGDSKASPLTIKHCPFHEEVRAYCREMAAQLGDKYELACEHAHSNIVLIAHTDFKVEGDWQTWIDYDKFTALATAGQPFSSRDYCAPTPPWAVYHENNVDGGFDPDETRFVRKGGSTAVTGGGC